ncbi:MAG: hypothetical protein LBD63_02620, partial [Mycoplasmataceae bacterium]|nr:hypothetical protein [Mycoplasmataceae bacterium]
MKKLKLISVFSTISALGLSGLAISTTLASCSQTYSIDMTSIKALNGNYQSSEAVYWSSKHNTLINGDSEKSCYLQFDMNQKTNPHVDFEHFIIEGILYYALHDGTANPKTIYELIHDLNANLLMLLEGVVVLIGKGEQISLGDGESLSHNAIWL